MKRIPDSLLDAGILQIGNTARLAYVMKQAQAGKPVTIGVLGGSITQGCAADTPEMRYANLAARWWNTTFPDATSRLVNAGLGATDSYLGVHRVTRDLLVAQPDIVIVEFSVNDNTPAHHRNSYDSLVRRLLHAKSNPAVILLFTTMEDGTSLQAVHAEIGAAYNLPALSYGAVVLQAIAEQRLSWQDISPDNIHPNNCGHAILARLLERLFCDVRTRLDCIPTDHLSFDAPPLTDDKYVNATLLDSTALTPEFTQGFTVKTPCDAFPNGWHTNSYGRIVFCVTARNLGLVYLKTTDGLSGCYDIFVDGKRVSTLNGDFSGGWGNYPASAEVYASEAAVSHTITLQPAEDSPQGKFSVLAILVS